MTSITIRRLALAAALSASGLAFAQSGGTGGPTDTKLPQSAKPVEQQAIDACKDHKEGDRVRFTDAKGKKRHYACTMVDGVLAARSGVTTPAKAVKKKEQ